MLREQEELKNGGKSTNQKPAKQGDGKKKQKKAMPNILSAEDKINEFMR